MYVTFMNGKDGRMPESEWNRACKDGGFDVDHVMAICADLGYSFSNDFYATPEGVVSVAEAHYIIARQNV